MLPFPQDPMLARAVAALPEPGALRGGCVYEPKFDGYRALLFVGEDRTRVQSRRGHDITEAFDDVAAAASQQLPAGLVVDGELVVWGGGALDFRALQSRLGRGSNQGLSRRPASFVAFDVLEVADIDVRRQLLSVRRELLESVVSAPEGSIQLAPQTTDVELARAWLSDYATADVGIEGLVVKGAGTTYRSGAREWLKYRLRDTVEAVVGAVTGSLEAPDHLVLAHPDATGGLKMVGTTTELSPRQRTEVGELLSAATASHPWDVSLPGGDRWRRDSRQKVHLVQPNLVVEVSVDNATDRGRWRHPTKLVRVRPDLGPGEVTPA